MTSNINNQKKLPVISLHVFHPWGEPLHISTVGPFITSPLSWKRNLPKDICSQAPALQSSLHNQGESLGIISYQKWIPGSMPLRTVERNQVSRTKHKPPNPLESDWITDWIIQSTWGNCGMDCLCVLLSHFSHVQLCNPMDHKGLSRKTNQDLPFILT